MRDVIASVCFASISFAMLSFNMISYLLGSYQAKSSGLSLSQLKSLSWSSLLDLKSWKISLGHMKK